MSLTTHVLDTACGRPAEGVAVEVARLARGARAVLHQATTNADGRTDGPLLADIGAIYLLGGRQGTVIRNNLLHDVAGVRIAWGIYLDEGCSNVLVENNLVHHTTHGGFHLHYGKENIVRNNIFALSSGEQQIQRTRAAYKEHRAKQAAEAPGRP